MQFLGPSATPVAQVDNATGEVEYLHSDLLGSPRLITDDSGVEVGTCTFDAFGGVASRTGSVVSAIGFSGNWTDPDTGLVYLRAREYDPATGQFLTVDPVVDATRQPYAYVGNNPVMLTDPSGLAEWWDFGNYDAENWQDFGAVAAGVVVGIAVFAAVAAVGVCTAATFGLCAVGVAVVAGAIAGAAAGAVTYGLQSGEKSWCGLAEAVGLGALAGALGGALGAGIGALFSKFVAPALKNLVGRLIADETGAIGGGSGGASGEGWAQISGIVRDAARGKGNFSLAGGTEEEALAAGRACVGANSTLAGDGKTVLSSDLLRQFRPPTYKPRLDLTQANFESRWVPHGQWQSNGHMTIRVRECMGPSGRLSARTSILNSTTKILL